MVLFFFVSLTLVLMEKVKVDIDALMERTAFDKQLAGELLACLESDLPEKKKALVSAASDANRQQMLALLHAFKGEIGIFGFVSIDGLIVSLELEIKNSADANYAERFDELFASIEKHIVELKKILNK